MGATPIESSPALVEGSEMLPASRALARPDWLPPYDPPARTLLGQAGGIEMLVALARTVGIREADSEAVEVWSAAPHTVHAPTCTHALFYLHARPYLHARDGFMRACSACGAVRQVESLLGSLDDPESDDGIEFNASIALRKLAIGHTVRPPRVHASRCRPH